MQCVGPVVHQVFLSIHLEVIELLTNNMVIFKFKKFQNDRSLCGKAGSGKNILDPNPTKPKRFGSDGIRIQNNAKRTTIEV